MAHILLVDDDPVIRKVFTEILTKEGHGVVCAENGQEGLELCQNNSFDLISSPIC
ncbi:MAG: response regulator [Deltaproteobacteria bacterium]|nr:response regulator [Deltaproteobacteria bacterium]